MLILAGAGSENKGINPQNCLPDRGTWSRTLEDSPITFTNKAAKEMRERVDKILGKGSEYIWVSTFHSTCVRILQVHRHPWLPT